MTITLRCRGWRGAAGLRYLQLWRLHCATVGGAGLQGYIACGYGDYTALLRVAQGGRASLPAAVATTLRCRGWRGAAGLRYLRL